MQFTNTGHAHIHPTGQRTAPRPVSVLSAMLAACSTTILVTMLLLGAAQGHVLTWLTGHSFDEDLLLPINPHYPAILPAPGDAADLPELSDIERNAARDAEYVVAAVPSKASNNTEPEAQVVSKPTGDTGLDGDVPSKPNEKGQTRVMHWAFLAR